MSWTTTLLCLCLWSVSVSVECRVSLSDSANAFAALKESTGCPAEFQGRCSCGPASYRGLVQYVTNCTNAEFQEVHMLRSLPVETEVLIFTGNEVFYLPVNLFGLDSSYPRLHTVDLSDNRIQGIRGRTFHTVSSVRTLILNDNDLYLEGKDHHPRMFSNFAKLEELQLRNAFTDKHAGSLYLANLADTFRQSELKLLRKLDLSGNGLGDFSEAGDIFCSLPGLEELDLSSNGLTTLKGLDLSCLEHLSRLNLSRNRLPSLDNGTLLQLESVSRVDLSDNPFHCDCALRPTLDWLGRLSDPQGPRCDSHGPWAERPLTSVLDDIPPCKSVAASPGEHHLQASYVVLSLVAVALCALLAVVLYRNRARVALLLATCSAPLRNKLNYSSLDKRDEAEMEV